MPAYGTATGSAPARNGAGGAWKRSPGPLRYHMSTAFFVVFYLVILAMPWVVTCILDVRPLTGGGSSFYDGSQRDYSQSDFDKVGRWMRAIRFLNLLVAMIALPVVLLVISHAAVVLMQRRKENQTLSLRKLLALADPPWMRIKNRFTNPGWLSLLGLGLVLIFAIQPPLQAVLVGVEEVQVATCADIPFLRFAYGSDACDFSGEPHYKMVGTEPEPADLASVSIGYLYPTLRGRLAELASASTSDYLASAVPADTNTGVLRFHALGLNSSIDCRKISRSDLPETCGGTSPLVLDYTTTNVEIHICVPGATNESAWTVSRSLQTVSEDLFVDMIVPFDTNLTSYDTNLSAVHCSVNTTRGYFELPNVYNGDTRGSLLNKWPDRETIANQFNDRSGRFGSASQIPQENDTETSRRTMWGLQYHPTRDYYDTTPAPLMTAMRSVFDNGSWFTMAQDAASRSEDERKKVYVDLCLRGLPLRYTPSRQFAASFDINDWCYWYHEDDITSTSLDKLIYQWFLSFQESYESSRPSPEAALRLALYHTNYVTLKATAEGTDDEFEGRARAIYTATGTSVIKPNVSPAARIIISLLIGIQAVALIVLLGFIYHLPTFSSRLDAASLFIFGAQLRDTIGGDMPKLGFVDDVALKRLERVNAVVGIDDPTAVEMTAVPPRRHDSDATIDADGDSAEDRHAPPAEDTMSEITVAMPQSAQRATSRDVPVSERTPSYTVSASGLGLISRETSQKHRHGPNI